MRANLIDEAAGLAPACCWAFTCGRAIRANSTVKETALGIERAFSGCHAGVFDSLAFSADRGTVTLQGRLP
jgi:hypothetical protein